MVPGHRSKVWRGVAWLPLKPELADGRRSSFHDLARRCARLKGASEMSNVVTMADAKRRAGRRRQSNGITALNAQSRRLIKQWATQFRLSHTRTVQSIVAHGQLLLKGKRALVHGNFCAALAAAGIQERAAQEFMRIANHAVLANPRNFSVLPATRSGLYYLSGLQETFVQDLLTERKLSPNTTKAELVELVEPTPHQDEPKVQKERRTKDNEIVWTEGLKTINEKAKTFFGGTSEPDFRYPGEVLWERDGETVVFTAPQLSSNRFHNRMVGGALVLFPLGQKFALFYKGERRDEFAATFGESGDTFVVAWGE